MAAPLYIIFKLCDDELTDNPIGICEWIVDLLSIRKI